MIINCGSLTSLCRKDRLETVQHLTLQKSANPSKRHMSCQQRMSHSSKLRNGSGWEEKTLTYIVCIIYIRAYSHILQCKCNMCTLSGVWISAEGEWMPHLKKRVLWKLYMCGWSTLANFSVLYVPTLRTGISGALGETPQSPGPECVLVAQSTI